MKRHDRSIMIYILLAAMILVITACGTGSDTPPGSKEPSAEVPQIETGIVEISKYGNIVLTVSPETFRQLGYETADMVTVTIGGYSVDMPVGTAYNDADSGEPICCIKHSNSKNIDEVVLAINGGDFAASTGLFEFRLIDEEPGFTWIVLGGYDESIGVTICMKEKQGYADEYDMHQSGGTRSNDRGDYNYLTDSEYANFRCVETTGMGRGTLYRSSSPVNPAYNRNTEADEALLHAGIATIMNMADSDAKMRSYEGYSLSYYSQCDIIALDMVMDISSEKFRADLCEGFRFLSSRTGPYLIHCNEGKDRTGFAVAVLEALMGAQPDEIVADYMKTYYNFYHIEAGTPQYDQIASGNVVAYLMKAFDIPSFDISAQELSDHAYDYLLGIGMSPEEIDALKENLSKDFGGQE